MGTLVPAVRPELRLRVAKSVSSWWCPLIREICKHTSHKDWAILSTLLLSSSLVHSEVSALIFSKHLPRWGVTQDLWVFQPASRWEGPPHQSFYSDPGLCPSLWDRGWTWHTLPLDTPLVIWLVMTNCFSPAFLYDVQACCIYLRAWFRYEGRK